MIPESLFTPQTNDWKLSLSKAIRRQSDLLEYCELEASANENPAEIDFPVRVTRYYASLIEKGNARDPLLLQVLADYREQQTVAGYSLDAVGDMAAMKAPGLIHKYQSRVLLTVTGACPIHCRYCFRRHFPYAESSPDLQLHSEALTYLTSQHQINEVILSGGDPLMLSDQKLSSLICQLNQLDHIRYLRVHSRLLSVLPERITQQVLDIFSQFKGRVIFVTHINHPNELSSINGKSLQLLSEQGFQLFNQTVILNGINDSADILAELSYKLFDYRITPYYLHKLDKVHGAAHFDIADDRLCSIYRQLCTLLPGYLTPKFVNELSGRTSKTPVQCF